MKLKSIALLCSALLLSGLANAQPIYQSFKVVKSVSNKFSESMNETSVAFKNMVGATAVCDLDGQEGRCAIIQAMPGMNNGTMSISLRGNGDCSSYATTKVDINLAVVNNEITITSPLRPYTFADFSSYDANCQKANANPISLSVSGNAQDGYVLTIM